MTTYPWSRVSEYCDETKYHEYKQEHKQHSGTFGEVKFRLHGKKNHGRAYKLKEKKKLVKDKYGRRFWVECHKINGSGTTEYRNSE